MFPDAFFPRPQPPKRKAAHWAILVEDAGRILNDVHNRTTTSGALADLTDALKRLTMVIGDLVERERIYEQAEDAANRGGQA